MKRREFLKGAGVTAGSCALASNTLFAAGQPVSGGADKVAGLPRRVLGRTGEKISIVGFAGLALTKQGQEEGTAGIHRAFDQGVNYFDVAPAYGNGDAEIKMGVGLQGLDRSRLFLACKTQKRDKEGAREELERSLTRLKTDHFDLYQMHAIFTPEEARQALGPGGAIETFLKAKEEGKVRYFGFSAHTTKGALEMMKGFSFDSIMFPITFVDYLQWGFGKAVMDAARERGVAVLAMKAMCRGAWPEGQERTRDWWYRPVEKDDEADLAVRFALSLPNVAAVVPPSFLDLVEKAIRAGRSYRPITDAEVARLRELGASCGSVFKEDEERVAAGGVLHRPPHPDNPHDYRPDGHASWHRRLA